MICSICEEIFEPCIKKDLIPVCPKCKEQMKTWEKMKKDRLLRRTKHEIHN